MNDIHIEVPVFKEIHGEDMSIDFDIMRPPHLYSSYDLKGVTQTLSSHDWVSIKDYDEHKIVNVILQKRIRLCHSNIDCMFNTGDYKKGIFILSSKNLPESWPVRLHLSISMIIAEVGETHTPPEKKLYIPFMGNSNFGLDAVTSNIIQTNYPEVIGRRLNLQMILEA